jgi:two-component system, OmpR family, sensor kinase
VSLRLRLTLTYSCLVALILVVFSVVLMVAMREALETEMDRRLRVRASQVQLTIWPGTTSLTAADLTSADLDLAPIAALNAPNVYVQVLGREGQVIAGSDSPSGDVLPTDRASLADALAGHTVFGYVNGDEDVLIRTLNVPILVDGNVVGVLQVGQSRQPLQETMARLQRLVQIIGAVSLVIAGLGGWLVAHRGLQVLSAISSRAASITRERDFTQRLQLDRRRDEVGELARTIDALLLTVDDTLRAHREFLADTSHELRNPLLAIRTNLDLLERVEDPEAVAECVSEARQQVDRMSRLVADLLLLARVEAREVVDRQPVALHHLVRAARREALGRTGDKTIEVREAEPTEVLGDAGRLAQVLTNLVDNALKHTPAGGMVRLDLLQVDGWARISVADDGEGIAPEHLPHVFDRFYRGRARVGATDDGSGLGLAIVKHLTEAHGGRVTAESQLGGGSVFTVWLPVGENEAEGA